MSPELQQLLEAQGATIVRSRYIVVENEDGTVSGFDDNGRPRVNKDKNGKTQDTFYVIPKRKKLKIYHGNSRSEVEQKMASKTPDIVKEKEDVEIFTGRTGS
jgi:hypothetical protein